MSDSELTLNDRLVIAFVQDARWWEYHKTSGTMWQSDQALAAEEAEIMLKIGALGKNV